MRHTLLIRSFQFKMSIFPHPHRLFQRRSFIRLGLASLLLIALSAPLIDMHVVNLQMPPSHSDYLPVRIGTLIALQRGDPYSPDTARQIQLAYYGRPLTASDQVIPMAFAYPVSAAIVLAPLAFIPWDTFRIGFLVVVPVLMAASVPLWLATLNLRLGLLSTATLAALFLASWPAMWALRQQQVTLIVFLLIASACFLLKRGWDASAAIALTLSTIKPQLACPLIALLLLWTVLQRRWRFPVAFAASSALLLLASLWLVPGWVPHWYAALAEYSQYTSARPILETVFGRWIGLALTFAVAVATTWNLWRLRRCDARSNEFGWAIALTLAATELLNPRFFALVYNQVLLLPAVLLILNLPSPTPKTRLARTLAIVWILLGYSETAVSAVGQLCGYRSALWSTLPFQNSLLSVVIFLALLATRIPGHPTPGGHPTRPEALQPAG
jgi:hypothetical protein